MPTTKKTTTAKTGAAKAPRKPRAAAAPKAKKAAPKEAAHEEVVHHHAASTPVFEKPQLAKDRYIFATGRRKSAVANVRLFAGSGDAQINKKPFLQYFPYKYHQEEVMRPFQLTGLGKDFYFIASVNGGGVHAQVTAVQHGIATALSRTSQELRAVLKKNGLLTRDPREKERKKPGLKRARRSPQWAKR